jgi:hypothetical protein
MTICISLTVGWALCTGTGAAEKKGGPEYDMETIMVKGHKDGLLDKVLDKTATKEEIDQMVKYYVALDMLKPEAGDLESWKQKTGAILKEIKAVQAGGGDLENLKKITNCKACHRVHRE